MSKPAPPCPVTSRACADGASELAVQLPSSRLATLGHLSPPSPGQPPDQRCPWTCAIRTGRPWGGAGEDLAVQPLPDFDQFQERCRDPMPRRYASIRPLVRLHDRTAVQRDEATHTPPETGGTLKRRFAHQGLRGLFPEALDLVPSGRQSRGPDEVVQALARLKGLSSGLQSQALGRIILYPLGSHLSDNTIKKLWQTVPVASPQPLPLLDSHRYPQRSQARWKVIQLSYQGWSKRSLSRFLP